MDWVGFGLASDWTWVDRIGFDWLCLEFGMDSIRSGLAPDWIGSALTLHLVGLDSIGLAMDWIRAGFRVAWTG